MKILKGKVVSNKMNNTLVVEREILSVHPLYRKQIRKLRKLKVHTTQKYNIGDMVNYVSCKPISKEKHYKTVEDKNLKV